MLFRKLPGMQQVWYANDDSASGVSSDLLMWWDDLSSKTWLVTKPEHMAEARAAFTGKNVNITAEGRPYLGSPLDTIVYCDQFVAEKVNEWTAELEVLSSIAETQFHAAYAAATHGQAGKWIYLARTTPNIETSLIALEGVIQGKLLPALTGRAPPNAEERDFLALPARLGEIGIGDPSKRAPDEFAASVMVTSPLKDLIKSSDGTYTFAAYEEQVVAKSDIRNQRRAQQQAAADLVKPQFPKFPAAINDPGSGEGRLELVDCTPSQ